MHGNPERADTRWPARAVTGPPGENRQRLKALEWENRELRRVNRSLKNALKSVVRRMRSSSVPLRFGTGDAADATAVRPVGACARLAETAQPEAALE